MYSDSRMHFGDAYYSACGYCYANFDTGSNSSSDTDSHTHTCTNLDS